MPTDPGPLDVALATASFVPECTPDEQLLIGALAARGVRAGPAVWDDPSVDWGRLGMCVIRSAWDAQFRRDEFVTWAERVGALTRLWNPPSVIRWNTHKGYLRELAARGVPIIPTRFCDRGSRVDLAAELRERGWSDAVVKPAVSAGASGVFRVRLDGEPPDAQERLSALLQQQDAMIQPYVDSVEGHGERALIFMDGRFTHSIRRHPALAGGTYDPYAADQVAAPADEVAMASRVLAAMGERTLYARVDLVRGAGGELLLMELELTEPNLFLRFSPEAVELLADAITRQVRG